ncbi:glycosyltransferase family 39 protein [Aurantiacibacter rhizosphaerae]|uniref:Glycosyltransferase RgtA/B/C/D-like domain-containing protein n=1 Tax=Aurantiacibacter rhizosphaerae TaxID=2691582 RepID=A0A844XIR1_9SPHN|nr:glycosyltransferase family 39 protein [Aurantiacibacter rhizosphaerae]MWV29455.1 hypothetical protein [Aurantiacibacter rhizosphaerae]
MKMLAVSPVETCDRRTVRMPAATSSVWPLLAVAALMAMQLSMVFTRAINWDEFWFYHHVADFARGNLAEPLQSLHVRLFAWLPYMPGTGVDKIVTARLFMLLCEAVTVLAIYALARRFVKHPVASLACLLYLSAGFVMQHGFSFRTDPMATAALMSALAILARCRLAALPLLAFALLVALAGMITMKAVLYAPAFLGLAWMRWSDGGFSVSTALRLAGAALSTIAIFLALYTWHSTAVTSSTQGAVMAVGASRWMFFLGVPPYWQMGVKAALTAPLLILSAITAPFAIWRGALTQGEKWGLTGLWLPVTLPFFYTNTAAYFYVFMLAPVTVAVVLVLQSAIERYSLILLTGVLTIMATGIFAIEDRETIHRQREVVKTVEALLPPGTAYFDHNGMIATLSKANWLMTPAVLSGYHDAGHATYRHTMTERVVPLLLANDEAIEAMLDGDDALLLPEDTAALRNNYLPFWGPIHIAGYAIPSGIQKTTQVLVPGAYTILGGPAVIDGNVHSQGAVVGLSRGLHVIAAPETAIRLQWGDHLEPPAKRFDEGPLYVEF